MLLYIVIFCVTVIVSLRNRTAKRRLFTFLRAGPPFVAVYSDIWRYGNSEFTQQDGRKETTAKRFSVTNVTGLLLACFVRNSLNTALFALLQKDLFKGMLSLVEGFFQTQLSSHLHTRFAVVFPLTFCYVSSLLMCQPRAYWL